MTALAVAGIHTPRRVSERGSTDNLCEQFLLAGTVESPHGWHTDAIGDRTLATHPTLPVVTIDDPAANPIGWLVGYPITQVELLTDSSHVTLCTDPLDFVDALGGWFLAIFAGADEPVTHPEAAGPIPRSTARVSAWRRRPRR